jgi:hypothetical protein
MDEHERLVYAADRIIAAFDNDFTGDMVDALNVIAETITRCGEDTEWCRAEVRGALMELSRKARPKD